MKDAWETADGGGSALPPATYLLRLQSAEVEESASSGNLQIHLEHLVVEGELAGEVQHEYLQIETAQGPFYVKQWIEMMGFDVPDDPADLPDVVEAISEKAPTYTGQVIEKKGFTNVRIKTLEDEGTAPAPAEEEEESEEAAPEEAQDSVEELEQRLLAFCTDYDVEVEDGDEPDLVRMKDGVAEYEWKASDLSDEEVELLEEVGAMFDVTLVSKAKKKKKK
jgi:hypothetical protein